MKKLIAAVLMCTALSANAEFISGGKLNEMLQGNSTTKGIAYGYIFGVFDATLGKYHCAPENVNGTQAIQAVTKALEAVPSSWDRSADIISVAAFRVIWPCKPEKQT